MTEDMKKKDVKRKKNDVKISEDAIEHEATKTTRGKGRPKKSPKKKEINEDDVDKWKDMCPCEEYLE